MKCQLAQTKTYLMAPNNGTISNKFNADRTTVPSLIGSGKFLESNVMKSFFMQIDSIFYEREKKCNYTTVNTENYAINALSHAGEFSADKLEFFASMKRINSKRKNR